MKNLLARLGEQYAGVNICVTIETHTELERIFRILLDGELSLHTRYITPDFGSLSLADFIELFT